MMEDYPRYGIVLVDGNSARFMVAHMGEIVEQEDVFASAPEHRRPPDGITDRQVAPRSASDHHDYLKRVATAAYHMVQEQKLDRLLIGGLPEVAAQFARALPRTCRMFISARSRSMPLPSRKPCWQNRFP